jgi:hypothetical protein
MRTLVAAEQRTCERAAMAVPAIVLVPAQW